MGGLFIAADADPSARRRAIALARPHFARAGLADPITIATDAALIDYYPKHDRAAHSLIRRENGDFALAVGLFIFEGLTGAPALRRFIQQAPSAIERTRGHFLLLIRDGGRMTLRADRHATYELYMNTPTTRFSTSFLALTAGVTGLTLRPTECLEYVIGGVTLGTATPIATIDRLDLGETIIFEHRPRSHRQRLALTQPEIALPAPHHIDRTLTALREIMHDYGTAFGKSLRISFSGGYDSRLLLALALDAGADPHLFVYGAESEPEVRYARNTAAAVQASFESIDKDQARPITLETFPAMLHANYTVNDGFSQYWMFRSDAENYARIARCAGPGLVMNGGGGEVFRNFFKFRGQSMSPLDFVRGFFSPFDPSSLTDPALGRRYQTNLAAKITDILGLTQPILDRAQVQALYPHLRCRSWFGRETSLDNRFGHRVTPFLEPEVVQAALSVPLRLKHFGIFEGRMIKTLSPALAAQMSTYGHSFDRDPPWRHRLGDLRLFAQPLRTRTYNFRLRKLRATKTNWPRELSRPYLESVIDPSFPTMSQFFQIDRIWNIDQFQRLCVLEYLSRELGCHAGRSEY